MTRPPGADRPLYTRIAASLKGRVLSGALAPGDRLPGEEHLSRSMGVSRSTIRQAIAGLRDAGYVTSRQGSGTFVAAELPIEPLVPRSGPVYTGFLDDLDDEATHVEELHRSQETYPADDAIAAGLRIPSGSPVTRYRAVRVRDGVIYGVASDVVPGAIANGITPDILAASPTIPDAMAAAGHPVTESLQRAEPVLIDGADADDCGVAPGSPGLVLTGVAYDGQHTPLDAYTLTIVAGYGIGLLLTRANRAG
ncbi:GntR family transcriptional regulator [Phytoactinopolyspora halotolerans]|uniref:GntR family transcriptional regulator n=1 Tax=Phytoactinopolyspora halotolerans TaxID=1981512 RepID=A0A6L9SE75_9ACTN|nr:GntR family transcriptional regulator [Phytoactinopolyspora halotolerans]NEE03423.1 GntR family transcriptional regulator [Phytoactinopolyspora halotolerans]